MVGYPFYVDEKYYKDIVFRRVSISTVSKNCGSL